MPSLKQSIDLRRQQLLQGVARYRGYCIPQVIGAVNGAHLAVRSFVEDGVLHINECFSYN